MGIINKLRYAKQYLANAKGLRQSSIEEIDGAYEPGSKPWLIAVEKHFGGYHARVKRRKVSPVDPRGNVETIKGGMTGGDRMLHHGYASVYADALSTFVAQRFERLTVAEVGILRGTGLALWSVLFPKSDIIGFDIDLSHTKDNLPFLNEQGAFKDKSSELYEFDQLASAPEQISVPLAGRKIDICIDDGLHSEDSIMNTMQAIAPNLNTQFVYFIEDNDKVCESIAREYPNWRVSGFGELTVVQPFA